MLYAWAAFVYLLTLNVLDYVSTALCLGEVKKQGPEWNYAPIWKNTRIGKWLVKNKIVSVPEYRKVEWYEHEINPIGQWILKHGGGIPGLAWFKLYFMTLIAFNLSGAPPEAEKMLSITFTVLVAFYAVVVWHNFKVYKELRTKRPPIRMKKSKENLNLDIPITP
jgi:hypothetical protein